MKAFISSVIFVLAMAVVAGYVLEGYFAVPADAAFARESVRVGVEGSIEHRHFSGDAPVTEQVR
ncbi:hypothetical protein [Azospirillum sp. SYSU D00513]|uniref:hypothetical protein n=1 Tax=Azospirillum sp. SYSU D00513 TaxID=2812561 RepID=UPI001A96482B|nr:hypothetical protein [Azospirillum sp. SYSU D00513]